MENREMESVMTNRFMQLVAVLLALFLSVPASWAATVNSDGEVMLRIGLASSSSYNEIGELIGANLWNNTGYGAGYRFGYFDKNLNFVGLARTDASVEQVSVIKTQNTWFDSSGSRSSYSNSDNGSSVVVGCYHIQVPGSYSSYRDASADAKSLGGFVAWINGSYQVRVGAYTTKEAAAAACSSLGYGTVVGTSSYGVNVVATGTSQILFQFDGGASQSLGIMPDVTGASDVRTWFWDIKYRGGFTYQRIDGGNITVANIIDLENYVKGVAPYEMGRTWPLEALKTQATCARTYALRRLNSHNSLGFDLCNSDHCQVYNGAGSKSTTWGPSAVSDQAVEETAGQVVWYKNSLAETVYSSSFGGASENAKYVWGTDTVNTYPYLSGVVDPYEEKAASINARANWTVTYTAAQLEDRLHSKYYGTGHSIDYLELLYSELGNVIKLTVHWDNNQTSEFKPTSIRSVFGVNSIRFTINGQTVTGGSGSTSGSGGSYAVNGSGSLSSLDGLYAISGAGTTAALGDDLYVISGSGTTSALEPGTGSGGSNQGGGTVTVSGSSYVFNGGGWGHQIGMSQYGAYAMSQLGFTYEEICEFYYPGTQVGPYQK